jgi:hypothetical protein
MFLDDDRVYTDIIKSWIKRFRNDKIYYPGIMICFEDIDSTQEHECYNVYIHRDSLKSEVFPPHRTIHDIRIHRPKEEVCICCWYDINKHEISVIPFEDNFSTELDTEYVTQLIFNIEKKYNDHF